MGCGVVQRVGSGVEGSLPCTVEGWCNLLPGAHQPSITPTHYRVTPNPAPLPGRDLYNALDVQAVDAEAAGAQPGQPQQRLFGWYRRGRQLALELAKALNYLHSKGIVHLDM